MTGTPSRPPLDLVAEIGQAEGSWEYVREAIEAFAGVGATMVKVQLLDPYQLTSGGARRYWQTKHGSPVEDQGEAFRLAGLLSYDRGEVTESVRCAARYGIELAATVFDTDALRVALDGGIRTVKVASGDITHRALIEAVAAALARFGGRLVFSTGAANQTEVHNAVKTARRAAWDALAETGLTFGWADPVAMTVLACTLAYPTPADAAALWRIREVRAAAEGHLQVGYSDHTADVVTGLVAAAAGARMLEKHATLNPHNPRVPDNLFALTPAAFGRYVDMAHTGADLYGDPKRPDVVARAEAPAREGARRALYATRDLLAGHVIAPGDLVALRPCPPGSLSAWWARRVIGGRLVSPVASGEVVAHDQVNDATPI